MARQNAIYVRLNKNGKSLHFSTGASTVLDGYSEAELWEKDGAVAVRPTAREAYHLSGEEGRSRKVLSNVDLVTYLCEKFDRTPGAILPGWLGADDVLFFGGMQPEGEQYGIDGDYRLLTMEHHRRAGSWGYVHDNWIELSRELRALLPPRLAAFQAGRAVLLLGELNGPLELTPKRRKENLILVSDVLADHLRRLYGGVKRGMRLRAAPVAGGVALADSLGALSNLPPERVPIKLSESDNCFMSVAKKSLYLSSLAWRALGGAECFELYAYKEYFALKAERTGTLRVNVNGYFHHIFSSTLCELLSTHCPGVKRLYLIRWEGLFLLCPSSTPNFPLPSAKCFCKYPLSAAACPKAVTPLQESVRRSQAALSCHPAP